VYRRRVIWHRIRPFVIGGAVVLLLVGAAAIGYESATSKGVDSDAAVVAAMRAGAERGEARGRRQGFREGFEKAREDAYRRAYAEAYVAAYRNEFEAAGLAVPDRVPVKRP
jgi:hypothetical protein